MISELEKIYWSLHTSLKPDNDILPLNLEQQKTAFFENIKNDRNYNPVFIYRNPSALSSIQKLQKLKVSFQKNSETIITNYYCTMIDRNIEWIENFNKKESSFSSWLSNLYGTPSADNVAYAESEIENLATLPRLEEEPFSGNIKEYFQDKLSDFGFSGWKVVFLEMPSRIKIDRMQKEVVLNTQAEFSIQSLQRLIIHELGTHVLRYENGASQPFELFRYGFPDYLETEEGLAVLSEVKTGLITHADMTQYCLRVIASDMAPSFSFVDIYKRMAKHTSPEQAFSIATRVKRGLTDTSQPGGYTKDQVYLSGYLKVKDLDKEDLNTLYLGKIGIQHLEDVRKIKGLNHKTKAPSWILD